MELSSIERRLLLNQCRIMEILDPENRSGARHGPSRRLGAAGYRLAFCLCHSGHDVDGKLIGLGHVRGDEPRAAVLKRRQERDIAAQAVELCDYQGRAGQIAHGQCFLKLRPAVNLV
jgi:hypothetical protein